MNIYKRVIVTSALFLSTQATYAYKIPTHDKLSQKTALCSILGQDDFTKSIGWVSIDNGNEKFKFKRLDLITKTGSAVDLTSRGLIGWGAVYEDEEAKLRPVNHFFNPLTSEGGTAGLASPDWALEDTGKIIFPVKQEYSYSDANNMIVNALTAADNNERKEAWGQFFQTLGMVVHHIQDMSQPQHVRNDNHCDGNIDGVSCYGFHNPSYYEAYTNENRNSILASYGCNSYPQIDLRYFTRARDFWITDNGNGRGMSEFTNHNFVSAGTNFDYHWLSNNVVPDFRYPNPDPQNQGSGIIIHKIDTQDPALISADFPLAGELWFYETTVKDNYLGTQIPNKRASTESLWKEHIEQYEANPYDLDKEVIKRAFNLNKFNFEAAYPFLIPRAIAYGAGLINYFFRGRLDVSNVLYLYENELIFTIKNITGKKNPGNAPFNFSEGSFSLYYDDSNGYRHDLTDSVSTPGSMDLVGGNVFADQDELTLSFNLTGIQDIDISKPFTLVFDGKIGAPGLDPSKWERGIAAKTFTPQRLLAFDVSRTDGIAPIPNIIDIYQSLDLGKSWQRVSETPVAISDDSIVQGNRLAVNAVTYIGGDGSLLLYPDYVDYTDRNEFGTARREIYSFRKEEFGASQGTAIPLDWNTIFAGYRNNASDHKAILRSLTYTGINSLVAIRIKHPLASDPTPLSRKFQILDVPDWEKSNQWFASNTWGDGGLPELSWRGGYSYAVSVYVEEDESNDPDKLRFDSAIRTTADLGGSYSDMSNFDDCVRSTTAPDEFCIQSVIAMDNNRLIGWVSQKGKDYFGKTKPGEVKLYTSNNNGMNWNTYAAIPLPASCFGSSQPYQIIDNLLYLGTHQAPDGTKDDVLFAETTCQQIIVVNGQYDHSEIVGSKALVSIDSGSSWTEVINPEHQNGRIIFAGDNGVVPGLFD